MAHLLAFLLLACAAGSAAAQSPAAKMRASVERVLAALPEKSRAQAMRPFDDRDRIDWHYTPRSRNGISLKELDTAGREAVHALLRTALSARRLPQGGQHHRARARAARDRDLRLDARSRALSPHGLRHARPRAALGLALRGPSPVAQLHARRRQAGGRHAELLRRQPGDGARTGRRRACARWARRTTRAGAARVARRRAAPRGGVRGAHLRRHRHRATRTRSIRSATAGIAGREARREAARAARGS